MTTRTHPFRQKGGASTYQERAVFWLLRAFTYIILGFGVLIFSIIIYRGAPAVLGCVTATPVSAIRSRISGAPN